MDSTWKLDKITASARLAAVFALTFLALSLQWVPSISGGPSHGPYVLSHCDWRTGACCPAPPKHCRLEGAAQDRRCTPGALNPAVRQTTIGRTICKSGYTSRIRPPTSYTDPLKLVSMKA